MLVGAGGEGYTRRRGRGGKSRVITGRRGNTLQNRRSSMSTNRNCRRKLESDHQSLRKIKSWKKSNIFWQNRTFFGKIEHFSKKVTKNQLWGCTFMANSGYHLVLSYYAICILWKIRVWCSTLSHSITVLPPLKFPSLAAATGVLWATLAGGPRKARRQQRGPK